MTQVWSATHLNSNLSGGGTTIVTQTATNLESIAYGSESFDTGKYYWETSASNNVSNGGDSAVSGLGTATSTIGDNQFPGPAADTFGVYATSTTFQLWISGVEADSYSQTNADGDRIANALDLNNRLYWAKNLTQSSPWYGSTNTGDPAAGTGGFDLSGNATLNGNPLVPAIAIFANGETGTGYFAQSSWLGTAPSGFGPFDVVGIPVWLLRV